MSGEGWARRMQLDDYQLRADDFPQPGTDHLNYAVMGLNAEAGELANLVCKLDRYIAGEEYISALITNRRSKREEIEDAMIDELGDVLWHVAHVATQLRVDLSKVAERNIDKLAKRYEREK